jgi:hypothetical protein
VAVLVANHRADVRFPEPLALLLLALAWSQIALLAVWCAFGGTPAPVRLFGLILGVVIWARLLCGLDRPAPQELSETTIVLLLLALFDYAPLAVLRLKGWRIVSLAVHPPTTASSRQFSLGYLMAWMTSVAVSLGLIKFCVDPRQVSRDPSFLVPLSIAGTSQLMLAGSCLYAALGQRHWLKRMMPLVGVCVFLVYLHASELTSFGNGMEAIAPFGLTEAALLVGSLYIIRGAGFRLGRGK